MMKVDTNIGRIRDSFGKTVSGLPDVQEEQTYDLAKVLSNRLQTSIMEKGLLWRNNMLNAAENIMMTESDKKVTYSIDLPQYAYYLENMDPHWVSLNRHPRLRNWADEKGIPAHITSIYVRPHPFIKPAMRQAYAEMKSHLAAGGKIGEWLENQL